MKRLLCVILSIIMVFGMLVTGSVPVSAAAGGSGTKSDPYTIHSFEGLKNALAKSGTYYIKLTDDMSDTNTQPVSVVGTKYLDLNGHTVKRVLDDTTDRYMFTVSGSLEINDSCATKKSYEGDGKIIFDNKIYTPSSKSTAQAEFDIQRNAFAVSDGGTLVLNRGKIICGSSKKEWMYDSRQAGNASKLYNGNAYVQINGAAVTVAKNGSFIMNGGYLEGRGYESFDVESGSYTRASVIKIKGGSNQINGGRIVGKGGADIFNNTYDNVVIRAGSFETEKVDGVWISRAKYKIAGIAAYRNVTMACSYGRLGIDSSDFAEGLKNKSISIIQDGKDIINKNSIWTIDSIRESKKNLKVQPIENGTVELTTKAGATVLSASYKYGSSYTVYVGGQYYFPTDLSTSSARLRIDIKSGDKTNSLYYKSAKAFNLNAVMPYVEPGRSYTLTGALEETWNNGEYVVVKTISPINMTVSENNVTQVNVSYNTSNVSDGMLKSGSAYNFSKLNIASATQGVKVTVSKINGKTADLTAAIEENKEYTLTLCVTAEKGYKISTATTVNAFGQSVNIKSYRGDTANINLTVKSACNHENTTAKYDGIFHYIQCDLCSRQFNKSVHTYGEGVIDGGNTRFTCTKCGYSYETDNGREKIDAVCIDSEQYGIGDKIPKISLIVEDYWGERYSIVYQWYKDSVAAGNEVATGTAFENAVYYLKVRGTIKDSEKYYFASDAYVAAMFFEKQSGTDNATETSVETVLRFVPLGTGSGAITFPNAPVIGASLYDVAKQMKIILNADDKSPVSNSFGLWITEKEEGKPEVSYSVEYDEETKEYSIVSNAFFQDITGVKVKANATYNIYLSGADGYIFKNVRVYGGKGVDKYGIEDNFLGVKCFCAYWEYKAVPVITEAAVPGVTFAAGKKAPTINTAGIEAFTLKCSYSGLADGDIIPCDKNVKLTLTLTAKDNYTFTSKDNLRVYLGDESCLVTSVTDKKAVAEYTINMNGHSLSKSKSIKATCATAGKTTAVCKICNKTVTVNTTKAFGHSYKKVTVAATTTANGQTMNVCSTCGTQSGKATIYKVSTVKLSKTSYIYSGKAQKPTVIVKDSKGNALKKGTDYKITYSSSASKNTGRYTVTVTFSGKYEGETVLSYTIVPKAPSSLKLTSTEKKTAKLSYGKTTGASGYEIYYSTKKTGTYKQLKSLTGTSYTYKKLTSGKTYYFKVRAYKSVNGEKIYGSFCTARSIKIK